MSTARSEIEELQKKLNHKKLQLRAVEDNCQHVWGDVEPDHIHHKGYTTQGDTPGTMGVDFRGPCHIPSRAEKRWKRTCTKCEKTEVTQRTKDGVIKTSTPVF